MFETEKEEFLVSHIIWLFLICRAQFHSPVLYCLNETCNIVTRLVHNLIVQCNTYK